MGYSIQIKRAVLKKVRQGDQPHHEIAHEFGIGRSTIGKWLRDNKQNGNIKLSTKEKRPRDWSAEERVSALIETGSMTAEERTAWCRKNGIYPHHLVQWKKDAISAMGSGTSKKQTKKEKKLKKQMSVLKKELSRKESALAEAAALLILKKKVQEILEDPEDE
ncbi:MAG: transposase [Gammaproteobacteria bacterium]|nr:transposase [Gammaproteobacteria bacterium]